MRRSGPLIVFPGVLALVACAGAPQEVHLPPASALATPIVVDPAFAAAPKILAGFELGSSAEDWQIGDQILIGIRVTKPGASTTRFLHVELMDRLNPLTVMSFNAAPAGRPAMQFESGLYYTRLSQYDEDAKLLDVAVGRFPEKLMGYGLFDGAAPAVGRKRLADGGMDFSSVTDAQAEHELFGWLSLFSFSTSMNKKGMFNEMMKDVVARPSLLAMLFNPSISLGMGREEELRLEPWSADGRHQRGRGHPAADVLDLRQARRRGPGSRGPPRGAAEPGGGAWCPSWGTTRTTRRSASKCGCSRRSAATKGGRSYRRWRIRRRRGSRRGLPRRHGFSCSSPAPSGGGVTRLCE